MEINVQELPLAINNFFLQCFFFDFPITADVAQICTAYNQFNTTYSMQGEQVSKVARTTSSVFRGGMQAWPPSEHPKTFFDEIHC